MLMTEGMVELLLDEWRPRTRPHPFAVCRWCGGPFVQIYQRHVEVGDDDTVRAAVRNGYNQFLCGTLACALRQLRWAMTDTKDDRPADASPWIYVPTPASTELHESTTSNVLMGGAAGGTKSHGLRWGGYSWCRKVPGYQVLLLRQTFPELEKTHLKRMKIDQHLLGDFKYLSGERVMVHKTNDSMITAGHCENVSDLEKYLSTEWDEIIVDEASLLVRKVLVGLSSRARSEATKPEVRARGGGWVRLGSNPGGPASLYLSEFYITRNPDLRRHKKYHPDKYQFIPAFVEDNPYLEDDYIETRLDPLDPERYEQLRFGNWGVFSGQFFPNFKASTHVREIPL